MKAQGLRPIELMSWCGCQRVLPKTPLIFRAAATYCCNILSPPHLSIQALVRFGALYGLIIWSSDAYGFPSLLHCAYFLDSRKFSIVVAVVLRRGQT